MISFILQRLGLLLPTFFGSALAAESALGLCISHPLSPGDRGMRPSEAGIAAGGGTAGGVSLCGAGRGVESQEWVLASMYVISYAFVHVH